MYDRDLSPLDWFPNYVSTYLERDVRQPLAVRDLSQFQRFVSMCAARSGQQLNLSSLGNHWLSVCQCNAQPYDLSTPKQFLDEFRVKCPCNFAVFIGDEELNECFTWRQRDKDLAAPPER